MTTTSEKTPAPATSSVNPSAATKTVPATSECVRFRPVAIAAKALASVTNSPTQRACNIQTPPRIELGRLGRKVIADINSRFAQASGSSRNVTRSTH